MSVGAPLDTGERRGWGGGGAMGRGWELKKNSKILNAAM